jgi:predicted N-acyltransferase
MPGSAPAATITPSLQSAAPFTPVTGRRLLVHPDAERETVEAALLRGAVTLCQRNGLSSIHITFCTEAEWRRGGELGLLQRQDQQFHWENRGYADFDAFLADLASRKRKQIRKERATATSGGVEILRLTGDAIEPEHWDALWAFYQDTGARKWGRPYLTRRFFEIAQETMRDDILLILCRREGRWIAGALNFIGRDCLYGRYWGCTEDVPCLHFEVCYYQAIEAAIGMGLARSRPARRARTSSPAAICPRPPTACTTSPTRISATPWPTICAASARRLRRRSNSCSTADPSARRSDHGRES